MFSTTEQYKLYTYSDLVPSRYNWLKAPHRHQCWPLTSRVNRPTSRSSGKMKVSCFSIKF